MIAGKMRSPSEVRYACTCTAKATPLAEAGLVMEAWISAYPSFFTILEETFKSAFGKVFKAVKFKRSLPRQ